MINYYQLFNDYHLDYGITDGPTLPDGSIMTGTIVDADTLPELTYKINVPDDETCPHFMSAEAVIVSEHFINVLQGAGVNNFQKFSVSLINPGTKKTRSGYFLFNVLGLLRAADLTQSSFDTLMEGDAEGVNVPLLAFNQITLDSTKIRGTRMFRLAEDPTILVIDETIKAALKGNKPDEGWGIILEELNVV